MLFSYALLEAHSKEVIKHKPLVPYDEYSKACSPRPSRLCKGQKAEMGDFIVQTVASTKHVCCLCLCPMEATLKAILLSLKWMPLLEAKIAVQVCLQVSSFNQQQQLRLLALPKKGC
jgi:hypothetical protein